MGSERRYSAKQVLSAATVAILSASLLSFGQVAHSTATPYSVSISQDAYVQGGTAFAAAVGSNYATNEGLSTKSNSANMRISYLELTYDGVLFPADGVAELSLFVASQNNGVGDGSPVTSGTLASTGDANVAFYVDVYGISDAGVTANFLNLTYTSTNNIDTSLPAHRNGITALQNPDGAAVSLGAIAVPVSNSIAPNSRVTLSTSALNDFLVADADDKVYIFLVRRDTLGAPNLVFHSQDSSTCFGPQLRNHVGDVSNAIYDINYLANGTGVTGLPESTTSNHLACGTTTVQAGPSRAGYLFTGWNTEPNGTGSPYVQGDRWMQPEDITLHAMWEVDPDYVAPADPEGQVSSLSQVNYFVTQGFTKGKSTLKNGMKAFINEQLDRTTVYKKFVCTGTVRGKKWTDKRTALARSRAAVACDYIEDRFPNATFEIKKRLIKKPSQDSLTVRIRVFS
jgi:uncharacterized repeat protein (TIGR02543 family)